MKQGALLINPPSYYTDEGIYTPLGLLSLASYIHQHSDFNINILDLAFSVYKGALLVTDTFFGDISSIILAKNPRVVGISTLSFTLATSLNIAKEIKDQNGEILVILGGPGVGGLEKKLLKKFNCVDFIISGEGEEAFLDVLNYIYKGRSLDRTKGVMYKNALCEMVGNPQNEFIEDLSILPLPDYNLVPPAKEYSQVQGWSRVSLNLELARGCSGGCAFCGCSSFWGRKRRCFPVSRVISHIKYLREEYNINHISLSDDNFLINRSFARDFVDSMIEANLGLTWDTRGRLDCIHRDILKALKKAGCTEILLGVESASDYLLEVMGKKIKAEMQYDKINLVIEEGIMPILSFILGYPDENKDMVHKTLYLILKIFIRNPNRKLAAYFHMLSLVPGTKLYEEEKGNLDAGSFELNRRFFRMSGAGIPKEDEFLIRKYPEMFPFFYNIKTKNIEITLLRFIATCSVTLLKRFKFTFYVANVLGQNFVDIFNGFINYFPDYLDYYHTQTLDDILVKKFAEFTSASPFFCTEYQALVNYELSLWLLLVSEGNKELIIQSDISIVDLIEDITNNLICDLETYKGKTEYVMRKEGSFLKIFSVK